jgi:hypothetical protein
MSESILDYYGFFEPTRLAELDLQPLAHFNWPGPNPDLPEGAAQHLGLDTYKARTRGRTDFLLGSADESLHPHERWVYLWQWSDGQGWYRIDHHEGVLTYVARHNFNATILGLHTRLQLAEAEFKGAWSASNLWQTYLHKHNMAELLQPILAQGLIAPADLHDLAFHYPRWLTRNPEYIDMPRELVWRMHGLGAAAEAAAENRRWGAQQMANDRSFLTQDENGRPDS